MPPSNSNQPQDPSQLPPATSDVNASSNPVQDQPAPSIADTEPVTTPAPIEPGSTAKKSKKPWIVATAVVVALISSGVAGALWWSSPQKTFDDVANTQTVIKGGTVKGSITVTPSTGTNVKISYDAKIRGKVTNTALDISADAGMMKLNMTGGVASDASNNVYFKVNNIRKTLTSFAGGNSSLIENYYGTIIDKVDGKWVQVTAADLKELSKDSGVDTACVMDKISGLFENSAYQKSLAELYSKNKYISIKETLGSEQINGKDSHHYLLAIDNAKAKSYTNAVKETQWFKDFKTCYTDQAKAEEIFTEESSSSDAKDPRVELWIDKWSHLPTKFVVTQDQDGSKIVMDGVMTFNDNQAVETPKAETQFKDLQKEMEKLQQETQNSYSLDDTTVLGSSVIRGL